MAPLDVVRISVNATWNTGRLNIDWSRAKVLLDCEIKAKT